MPEESKQPQKNRPVGSLEDLFARARGGKHFWSATPTAQKRESFERLQKKMLNAADDVSDIMRTTSKAEMEVISTEILPLLESVEFCQKNLETIKSKTPVPVRCAPHKKVLQMRRPRGVVLLVAPSNFPLSITGTEILSAVTAGNAVIVKPSPQSEAAVAILLSWFAAAGFPRGLIQSSLGNAEHVYALVEHRPDYVTFIGSTPAGRQLAARCAERGIAYRTELGGKATALVLSDADMARTVHAILWGAFMGAGRICAGVQRVFVASSCYDDFTSVLKNACAQLVVGRDIFKLDQPEAEALLSSTVGDAMELGGHVFWSAEGSEGATILECPNTKPKIFHAEVFAPVFAFTMYEDIDDAVVAMNAGPGDLMASVFTRSKNVDALRMKIDASTVMVNDVLWSYGMPEVPWGGGPKSSDGATHGLSGIEEYSTVHHTIVDTVPVSLSKDPYWFPYTPSRVTAMREGLSVLYGSSKEKAKSFVALARNARQWIKDKS